MTADMLQAVDHRLFVFRRRRWLRVQMLPLAAKEPAMSRAFNLDLTESAVVKHCRDGQISISALELLPDGGVRLVCSDANGAAKIRAKLRRHMITGHVRRTVFMRSPPLR